MAFVDPERFKRFEQFFTRHLKAFLETASRGFVAKGPGAVVYQAPDGKFDQPVPVLRLQYRAKSEIDAMHAGARDELIQGMLDRYQPPGEAVLVALYQDNTYDVTRVVIQQKEGGEKPN